MNYTLVSRTTAAALLLGVLFLVPAAAEAQRRPQPPPQRPQPQVTDTVPDYILEGVTVTITRGETRAREVPQRIEVITRTDIERTPADELADLLKKQAAVDVIQYPGLLSGIGIRGFRPEFSGINQRTLLLIDGRPAGTTNLATIDPATIERVEVLKGPAAALYGSSAMGGAVNLITRRSAGDLRGNLGGGIGSFRARELDAHLGGNLSDQLDLDLAFRRFTRSDFRIGEGNFFRRRLGDTLALKLYPDGTTRAVPEIGDGVVRENSSFGQRTGSARFGYQLSPRLRTEARGEVFEANNVEAPGDLFAGTAFDGLKNLRRRTGEVSLAGTGGRQDPLIRLFATDEQSEHYATWAEDPFISFAERISTRGAQAQQTTRIGQGMVVSGVDRTATTSTSESYAAEDVRSAPFSPDWRVHSTAVFVHGQLNSQNERWGLSLGGRYDRITLELRETPHREDLEPGTERFSTFNPAAGLQLRPSGAVRLQASAGRAFVVPTAFQKAGLALPGAGTGVTSITIGNTELRPERSFTWDAGIGLGRPRGGLDAEVTYFRTRVSDRITGVLASFPEDQRPTTPEGDEVRQVQTYVNAAAAHMQGLEWRLAYDLGARTGFRYSLRLFANATHIFRSEETVTAAMVDAERFAGQPQFEPEQVFDALVFGDEFTSPIRNVADLTLNYGIEYDSMRGFSTRLSGRYVGERVDTDFTDFANITDIRYPPFMVLDLTTTLRLGERSRLGFVVSNLTNENYYEVRGYNLPGREYRLNLSLGF